MTSLDRMQDLLPLPYSVAGDALITALLNDWALEIESFEEDIDRLRRSTWVETAYRDSDLDKLAALVDVRRFPGEPSTLFRKRLLALVRARLSGTIGRNDILSFAVEYIKGVEEVLKAKLVHRKKNEDIAEDKKDLGGRVTMVEFPERTRFSRTLADRAGRVAHLYRWTEENRGLDEAPVTFLVHGAMGGATTMPALINLTTRSLYGWRGVVPAGRTLVMDDKGKATLDGRDATERLFTAPIVFGQPLALPAPGAPQHRQVMQRGFNDWMFATIGFYDERGYDHVHFLIEDPEMTEGVFDESRFDRALFPGGTIGTVQMSWIEKEAASFEVHVPRTVVMEPRTIVDDFIRAGATRPPHEEVAEDLGATIQQLRAAGVKAALHHDAFHEWQRQIVRFAPSWIVIPPERGSAGEHDEVATGARFDETALGRSRFN